MKKHLMLILLIVISLSSASTVLFAGEKPTLPQTKTKVANVAVFKDGYGFFVRTGLAKLQDGWMEFDYIPNAVLGTVWAYTNKPDEQIDLLIRSVHEWESEETVKVEGLIDLLFANMNRRVTLIDYNYNKRMTGEIVDILQAIS